MSEGEVVLTQDRSSGVVHKRIRVGQGLASLEADNLDQAGAYDVLADLGAARPSFRLCVRCFPAEEPHPESAP